jgi:hypothetical protein
MGWTELRLAGQSKPKKSRFKGGGLILILVLDGWEKLIVVE